MLPVAPCEWVGDRVRAGARDRAQAEAIVNQYGRTPLDYFKLWPDKSHYFSPSCQSVIAYRASCSVAVSLGDPVGPVDEIEPLIQSSCGSPPPTGGGPRSIRSCPTSCPCIGGRGYAS